MAYDNYTNLVQAVKDVSEDDSTEFANYIPTAIHSAELRLTKETDTLGLKQNVEVPAITGNRAVSKPLNYLFPHDIYTFDTVTGIERRLKQVPDDYLRDFWPTPAAVGSPRYYSNDYHNDTILLAPTPDKDYVIRMNIEANVTPISALNPTNYFTNYCGDALFYATMVEMHMFMKNAEEMATFETKYQNTIAGINNQGRRNRRDDGFPPVNPSGGQNTLKGEV